MTYKDIPGYCDYHWFYKRVFDVLPINANVAEIGAYLGHSVVYMASLARDNAKPIKIYAVDTFEGSEEHKKKGIYNFADKYLDNLYACNVGEYTHTFTMTSVEAANHEKLSTTLFDFIFIDAAHDYESVKTDIQGWMTKVKPGGILAGHDYVDRWPGVKLAVDQLLPNRTVEQNIWWIRL
jgi:predicted O-methyltransferase YrrM